MTKLELNTLMGEALRQALGWKSIKVSSKGIVFVDSYGIEGVICSNLLRKAYNFIEERKEPSDERE